MPRTLWLEFSEIVIFSDLKQKFCIDEKTWKYVFPDTQLRVYMSLHNLDINKHTHMTEQQECNPRNQEEKHEKSKTPEAMIN